MSEDKKRLTLTGKNIPDSIYNKLYELGNTRQLTPYVVSLVEKEQKMDSMISHLSSLLNKMDTIGNLLSDINNKVETNTTKTNDIEKQLSKISGKLDNPIFIKQPEEESIIEDTSEEIHQGKLGVTETIESGIDEEITDYDF